MRKLGGMTIQRLRNFCHLAFFCSMKIRGQVHHRSIWWIVALATALFHASILWNDTASDVMTTKLVVVPRLTAAGFSNSSSFCHFSKTLTTLYVTPNVFKVNGKTRAWRRLIMHVNFAYGILYPKPFYVITSALRSSKIIEILDFFSLDGALGI